MTQLQLTQKLSKDESKGSNKNRLPNVGYTLFMYREELRRRNTTLFKLSKTKLELTEELVSYSVKRITEYSVEELMNLDRQIMFSRRLQSRMQHIKTMEKLRTIQKSLTLTL